MLGRHTCLAAGTCAFVNFKKLDSSNNTLNITQLKLEKYRHLTFADCREFLFYWSASSIWFGLRWWLFFGRLWAHVVLVGRICCHRRRRRRRRLHLSIKHCPSFFVSTCEKIKLKTEIIGNGNKESFQKIPEISKHGGIEQKSLEMNHAAWSKVEQKSLERNNQQLVLKLPIKWKKLLHFRENSLPLDWSSNLLHDPGVTLLGKSYLDKLRGDTRQLYQSKQDLS